MLRKMAYITFAIAMGCAAFYAYLVWDNNLDVEPPSRMEIESSLESSIDWLMQNQDEILRENNSVLWWMIRQSQLLTESPRLQELFSRYESRYLRGRRNDVWRQLFDDNTWVPVRYENISHYPYYNKYFIYAMTCDRELGQHPEIAAQNEPQFCNSHFLKPACVTHQLMGIRIMQRKNCGDQAKLESVAKVLQARIAKELTWDPRVVDVYLQRVLMLFESGAGEKVKPVWLRRILDAQNKNGGWGGFYPLIPLVSGYNFGFSAKGIGIEKAGDNFHTTAQGVFIMSLLIADE